MSLNPRVTSAAAKLALFYCAFVALEAPVLIMALGADIGHTIRELVAAALGSAIAAVGLATPCFFGAFLLLAAARRLGLVISWILLLGLWVIPVWFTGERTSSLEFPELFLLWSILALPLWVIGQLGISSRTSFRVGAARVSPSAVFLAIWALLLAGVRFYGHNTEKQVMSGPFAPALAWIWGLAPVALSLFAIRHVWRGTATPSVSAIEQSSALG